MKHGTDARIHSASILAALNLELGWGLDADQQQAYLAMLALYLASALDDPALRALIERFHADHRLVRALRDRADPLHAEAWSVWCAHAIRIAQRHGFGAAGDSLADADDLAQLALEELAQALPSYRYASRFSTWAYTIIARRVQRYVRDSRAAKRAVQPISLDAPGLAGQLAASLAPVDAPAEASALLDLIVDILSHEPDQRLARIFYLWVVEEQRLAQIGQQMELSAGRLSTLIGQCRQILQRNPAILDWIDQLGGERAAVDPTAADSEKS